MRQEVPTAVPVGQQGLRVVIRLLCRCPCEGQAVELGRPRQWCRLPVGPAVRLARRSARHRLTPAIQSATNGAPPWLHRQTAELRRDQIDYRSACSVPSADPFMNVGAAHAFVLVPLESAAIEAGWDYRWTARAEGPSAEAMAPRQAGRRQRHRLARATPVEDRLRTAAVEARMAGFLRAARPLSMWLDTTWVSSHRR
jgi:hypothetical protein